MDGPAWKLFDRVADDYDEVAPFFAQFGAAIVAVLDPPVGCRFLDLGAGRGALTGPALERGCVVTAVDAAPAMLKRLATDHPAATTCVMDVESLAFQSGSFDLVASSFVIHILDDPVAGIAEAYRVLAPGGRFALTGGSARTSNSGPPAQPASLGSRFNALFAEFAAYLPSGGSMGTPIDCADLLEAAGFVELRQDVVEVATPFADQAMLWRWAMSHGYRAFIEDLPDEHRHVFHQRVLELPDDDLVLRRVSGVWSGRKPE
ncbi:methyltransferase domain-containing protein [Micromonospora sp. CPCC 205371]|nr:methyltransferase domain-containing protein [Micromonospora sp. CPCC 205371]